MRDKTFTQDLRARVERAMERCPTCGHLALTHQEAAAAAGLNASTIWRFLSGKAIRSETLDAILAWLDKVEKARKGGRAR